MLAKKICYVFIVCLLVLIFFSIRKSSNQQTFQQINSFQEAFPALSPCNNRLIFFDIDDTLISTIDTMGHSPLPLWFMIRAIARHPQLLFKKNIERYYSIMWQQTKWFVIEPDIVPILAELQSQDCIILGLTSMETGTFGVIENFPAWRSEVLTQLGIEFSRKFPNSIFSTLPRYRNNYPELYNGILCCNQQSKGAVVAAFLDQFKLQPNMIIFFDDSVNNLTSVANACKERNILFKGFQYRGAEKFTQKWDMQKALLQLDYLIEHKAWLADKIASTAIN